MSSSLARRFAHNFLAGLTGPFRLLSERRALLSVLVRRDIAVRTSGTLLGGAWMLAQPGLQVLAFWFLLDFVLKVRFPGQVSFISYFLLGMLPWLMMSEAIQRNLTVLSEFSNLYQRTVFPVAILPLLPVIVSGMFYTVIFTILAWATEGAIAALMTPVVSIALLIWIVPVCYLMAVLGLFIRDARQVIPFLLTLTMYLTPILYVPEMLPPTLRDWMVLNPFADLMALIHGLLQGMPLTVGNFVRPFALWLVMLAPAWVLFRRTEPHMREEL